ncbi:hypothetical protein Tco_1051352 [Tanacetum coccineum]
MLKVLLYHRKHFTNGSKTKTVGAPIRVTRVSGFMINQSHDYKEKDKVPKIFVGQADGYEPHGVTSIGMNRDIQAGLAKNQADIWGKIICNSLSKLLVSGNTNPTESRSIRFAQTKVDGNGKTEQKVTNSC